MYNSVSLHDKIMREYEKIRNFNKNEFYKINNELYEKLPEIREIDNKISSLAIKYASDIVSGALTPEDAVLAVEKDNEIQF